MSKSKYSAREVVDVDDSLGLCKTAIENFSYRIDFYEKSREQDTVVYFFYQVYFSYILTIQFLNTKSIRD